MEFRLKLDIIVKYFYIVKGSLLQFIHKIIQGYGNNSIIEAVRGKVDLPETVAIATLTG